jgi:hypothetical protein
MNIFEIVTRYSSRCTYILHHTMIKFFRHSLDEPPPPTRDIRSLACCASITRRKRMIKHKSITLGNDWLIHPFMHSYYTYTYYNSILMFWKCNPTILPATSRYWYGWNAAEWINRIFWPVSGWAVPFLSIIYSFHFRKVVTKVIDCLLII